MNYSKKTAKLLDKMCKISERESYQLQKKKGAELLLKTFDLFNLPRPKKIKWYIDLDEEFLSMASMASSASSAYRESNAYRAYRAYRASSAYRASNAYRAYRASRASMASSASMDYDFNWFIFSFEYKENPDEKYLPNENDEKYLEYCDLLLQAKETGIGYWCEWKDILHLVPIPLCCFDEQNRFHSLDKSAIEWPKGEKIYEIHGVIFDKKLWKKVIQNKLSAQEVFAIKNTEQRRLAYGLMDKTKMKELKDYQVLDERKKDEQGNIDKVISFTIKGFDEPFIYYNCICPSTGREYFIQIKEKTCVKAKEQSFGLEKVEWVIEW